MAINFTQEHLGWQKPTLDTAQWTRDHDGLEWESLGTGWHIAAAQLAGDHKLTALDNGKAECHPVSMAYKRRKCNGGNRLFSEPFREAKVA
jgi:hypothetical protein